MLISMFLKFNQSINFAAKISVEWKVRPKYLLDPNLALRDSENRSLK